MVAGVLYAPNAVGLIEAFDAGSGKTVWVQEPAQRSLAAMAGQSTRGVDFWEQGGEQRLAVVRGTNLYTLDAKTGKLLADFGDKGMTSLKRDELYAAPAFRETQGPIVVGDVIVVA